MQKLVTLQLAGLLGLLARCWLPGNVQAQAPAWQLAIVAPSGAAQVMATATDANGNVYLAGYFSGAVAFGSASLSTSSTYTTYVAKWDASTRQFAWATQTGGTGTTMPYALAVSGGMVYVGGTVSGSALFGSYPQPLMSAQGDGFVAALSTAGTWVWARQLGSNGYGSVSAVVASGSSIYVAGFCKNFAVVGTTMVTVHGAGDTDCVVARLTEAGPATAFDWAVSAGGTGYDCAYSLALSGSNLYVGGTFSSAAASFGSSALANSAVGTADGFVAKVVDQATTASFRWAQALHGPGDDVVQTLAASGTAVYVGGTFATASALGSLSLSGNSTRNGYVAKLLDAGSSSSFQWASAVTCPDVSTIAALAVSGTQVYATGYYTYRAAWGSTTLYNPIGTTYVLAMFDAGASVTYPWALSASSVFSFSTGQALALAGSTLYVAGWANGPTTFGASGTPTLLSTGTSFLTALGYGPLTTTPAATYAPTLAIYPSPATNTARLTGAAAHRPGQVLDVLGRCVATFATDATGTALLPAGLAPGVYVVRVGAGAGRWVVE